MTKATMVILRALLFAGGCDAQAAEQIGGRPPKEVESKECGIANVFAHLSIIKSTPACTKGCFGGKCPADWYPGKKDTCAPQCGQIFEPFWDQCGHMLSAAKMVSDEASV